MAECVFAQGLTDEEVAAESRGRMPPQAMMRLSSTCEMRCTVLWTNTTFSLLFTKSITVLVEWLQIVINTVLLTTDNKNKSPPEKTLYLLQRGICRDYCHMLSYTKANLVCLSVYLFYI